MISFYMTQVEDKQLTKGYSYFILLRLVYFFDILVHPLFLCAEVLIKLVGTHLKMYEIYIFIIILFEYLLYR